MVQVEPNQSQQPVNNDLEDNIKEPMNTIHSTDITGYHDFQVDASVADGSAGIAAVYKSDSNDADDFLATNHLRVKNVLQGELAAISLALSTAKQLGMERVAIQSDCKTAVTNLSMLLRTLLLTGPEFIGNSFKER
ncbi:hypothetical protein G4B88_029243 [Cannabis sativa]|uniref:RNase H type-1 domain-containing protein n=1 Tax=Cannabis sativa TaxID=3483 RepID=A0A7J6EWV5_CANSA|nr:hypothetical protein G4B88_029243 [Cannabis sativa]